MKNNELKNFPEEEFNDKTNDFDIQKSMKSGSLFQILYYNLHNGRKTNAFHLMNSVEIYDKCKSRELITSFNKSGLCVSDASMKKHRNNLAKLAVLQGTNTGVPLPSHFSTGSFTLAVFDNFDHAGRNTLSGTYNTHDTVLTLFQENLTILPQSL